MKKATSYLVAILAMASMFAFFTQREAKAEETIMLRSDGDVTIGDPSIPGDTNPLFRTCTLYNESGVVWGKTTLDFTASEQGTVTATMRRILGQKELGKIVMPFPTAAQAPDVLESFLDSAGIPILNPEDIVNATYMIVAATGAPSVATGVLSGIKHCTDRSLFELEQGLPVRCNNCLCMLSYN